MCSFDMQINSDFLYCSQAGRERYMTNVIFLHFQLSKLYIYHLLDNICYM